MHTAHSSRGVSTLVAGVHGAASDTWAMARGGFAAPLVMQRCSCSAASIPAHRDCTRSALCRSQTQCMCTLALGKSHTCAHRRLGWPLRCSLYTQGLAYAAPSLWCLKGGHGHLSFSAVRIVRNPSNSCRSASNIACKAPRQFGEGASWHHELTHRAQAGSLRRGRATVASPAWGHPP